MMVARVREEESWVYLGTRSAADSEGAPGMQKVCLPDPEKFCVIFSGEVDKV